MIALATVPALLIGIWIGAVFGIVLIALCLAADDRPRRADPPNFDDQEFRVYPGGQKMRRKERRP